MPTWASPHRLISEMVALGEPLVGVVYPKRSINLARLHSLSGQPFARAYARFCSFIGTPGEPHPRNPAFRRVDGCGTGFMLIARTCIERILDQCQGLVDECRYKHLLLASKFNAFITPFKKIELEDRELSEDLSFCYRLTQACGGLIYANVTSDIEHVGSLTVKTA